MGHSHIHKFELHQYLVLDNGVPFPQLLFCLLAQNLSRKIVNNLDALFENIKMLRFAWLCLEDEADCFELFVDKIDLLDHSFQLFRSKLGRLEPVVPLGVLDCDL